MADTRFASKIENIPRFIIKKPRRIVNGEWEKCTDINKQKNNNLKYN